MGSIFDFSNKYMKKILANFIFLSHIVFGLWLLVGWTFAVWQLLYITSLLMWIGSWVVFGLCPLTYMEFWLRRRVGQEIDLTEEFIHYYTKKIFGIDVSMPAIFVGGVITFGTLLYLSLTTTPLG